MSKQVEGSSVWMAALGVFVVAFVLLLLIGYSFLAALIFARCWRSRRRSSSCCCATVTRTSGSGTAASYVRAKTRSGADARSDPGPSAEGRRRARRSADVRGAGARRQAAPVAACAVRSGSGIGSVAEVAPPRLDAPRAGKADDLKRIKGVGPKIEDCAAPAWASSPGPDRRWGAAEIAWMDEHLEDFRGRVSRDDWVGQARLLAAGGETDFSRRVDDGEVYTEAMRSRATRSPCGAGVRPRRRDGRRATRRCGGRGRRAPSPSCSARPCCCGWVRSGWAGGSAGTRRRVFLFDLAALAAFLWAMIVTVGLWRARKD